MKVKDLLSKHQKWCKGYSALDTYGRTTQPNYDEACRWCLSGAVDKILDGSNSITKRYTIMNKLYKAINKLFPKFVAKTRKEYPGMSNTTIVVEFNDASSTTFRDVKRVLKEANV